MKKMTKMGAGLAVLLMSCSWAMADDKPAAQTGMVPSSMLGVEAGINLANLNGPNLSEVVDARMGFVGGAFLNFHLLPNLAIQPEVLYEQKGGSLGGNAYQLDYVEIPVLVDLTVVGPLSVLVGPAFDSTVASQGVSNVNSTDTGLVLGAQLMISNFLLSGRYEIGLNNVSSNQNLQNGTFTFMAGLSLI